MINNTTKMRVSLQINLKQKQIGFSLIELLVSMAIGLVILGALFFTYMSGLKGNVNAQAQAQVSEDSQIALNIISQQIRQAGYASGTAPGVNLALGRGGFAFFACDTGFSNGVTGTVAGVTTAGAANMSALTCSNADATKNAGGIAASFAVAYEADITNTKANGAGNATDCNGNGLGAASGVVVENRFYLSDGTLYCAGSNAAAGVAPDYSIAQPLVNGVESMHFQFGLAGTGTTLNVADATQVEGYVMSTSALGPATGTDLTGVNTTLHSGLRTTVPSLEPSTNVPPPTPPSINANAARWRMVRTVRICIVGKNDEVLSKDLAVSGKNPQYYDCNGTLTDITDGKMRKAYATTVFLRNLNR